MRVLIGMVEVAGFYSNLARGFHGIGINADYVTLGPHPFDYPTPGIQPYLLRMRSRLNHFRVPSKHPLPIRWMASGCAKVILLIWSLTALFYYDVFIFGYGTSLLPKNIDLPLLRFLGKTVVSNLGHGSEARPPYIDGTYQSKDGTHQPSPEKLLHASRRIARKVQTVQRWSRLTIGTPYNLAQFAQRPFVNLFAIGLPFAGDTPASGEGHTTSVPDDSEHNLGTVRILHCPSHPAVKGSSLIEQAIGSLRSKGYSIDFIRLQGKPHREVIAEIQQCDFVVDQIYSDTPLASFALEAAWFGKPSVVGGYGLEELRAHFPEGMWPPSKICHPDGLESAIEDLIVNRHWRLQLGQEAMRFAREKWCAQEVSKRFLRLIEGDIPTDWWVDPHQVVYLEGVGQSIDQSQQNIRLLIEKFGIGSLQLSQKPALENAFKSFAYEDNKESANGST